MVKSTPKRITASSGIEKSTATRTKSCPPNSNTKSPKSPRLRKEPSTSTSSSKKRKIIDLTGDDEDEEDVLLVGASSGKKQKNEQEEKRLRPFRSNAPHSFLQKLERAQTQRMIVIGRSRSEPHGDRQENIDIVGTTGNIYTVTIGRLPSCTCPDHRKGNECKHKVYALSTVLKAPYELQYQRAFLSSEVHEILTNAPPIPDGAADSNEDNDGKRKPIEGECPICYMDFDPDSNELVWCRAACGNNIHKDCFQKWATSQQGQELRCVYCRTPWQIDKGDVADIKKAGQDAGDGYVNVADRFGMSQARDYSSYHQPWVRRNFGYE